MADSSTIRTSLLLGALAAIFVLAIVLPFGAVHTLHARRLDAADADLHAIAGRIAADGVLDTASGSELLIGGGDLPRATDPRWTAGTRSPLSGLGIVTRPDPWGNAFIVNVGASGNEAVWVLSAGPDGVIDTPFNQQAGTASVSGDDLARRVR